MTETRLLQENDFVTYLCIFALPLKFRARPHKSIGENCSMKVQESVSDYDYFIKRSLLGNIFQTREYYEVLKEIGWDPFVLTVMDGKECYGGLIAYSPISVPVVSRFFHRVFVYFGPVIQAKDGRVLRLLLEHLNLKAKQMGAIRVDIRTPLPFPQQHKIFAQQNFERYDAGGDYSILIDLTKDSNTLWYGLKKTFRKRIRKALKEGVYLKKVEAPEELHSLYQIYLNTSKRRKFFPYPFAFFKALWSQLEPRGFAQFLIALYKKQVIAGMINMVYKGKVTTFISGSLRRFWKLNPNHVLQWHSIVRSKKDLHAHTFDICHLPATKTKSQNKIDYYTFKTSFGGSLVKESSFYYKITSRFRYSLFRSINGFSENLVQNLARERHSTNWKCCNSQRLG